MQMRIDGIPVLTEATGIFRVVAADLVGLAMTDRGIEDFFNLRQ